MVFEFLWKFLQREKTEQTNAENASNVLKMFEIEEENVLGESKNKKTAKQIKTIKRKKTVKKPHKPKIRTGTCETRKQTKKKKPTGRKKVYKDLLSLKGKIKKRRNERVKNVSTIKSDIKQTGVQLIHKAHMSDENKKPAKGRKIGGARKKRRKQPAKTRRCIKKISEIQNEHSKVTVKRKGLAKKRATQKQVKEEKMLDAKVQRRKKPTKPCKNKRSSKKKSVKTRRGIKKISTVQRESSKSADTLKLKKRDNKPKAKPSKMKKEQNKRLAKGVRNRSKKSVRARKLEAAFKKEKNSARMRRQLGKITTGRKGCLKTEHTIKPKTQVKWDNFERLGKKQKPCLRNAKSKRAPKKVSLNVAKKRKNKPAAKGQCERKKKAKAKQTPWFKRVYDRVP